MRKLFTVLLCTLISFPALAEAPRKIVKIQDNSTVLIRMKVKEVGSEKEGWGSCSGVYIDTNVILTASHCVSMPEGIELKQLWVKKGDTSERATTIKIDTTLDLALLYTPMNGVPVKLAKSVRQGEKCFVLGNPLGIQQVITEGMVSSDTLAIRERKGVTYLLTDAVVLPGNSGGALLDKKGHLIGIVVMSTSMMGMEGASGLGIAVALDTVKQFLEVY